VTRAEEDSECDQERKDEFGHKLTVVTRRNALSPTCRAYSQPIDFTVRWGCVYRQELLREGKDAADVMPCGVR
jgi:hypothetical protein